MIVILPRVIDLETVPGEARLFRVKTAALFVVDCRRINVPADTLTDLASIPDPLQSFIQNDSPVILRPAVLHDFLYQSQGRVPGAIYTRADCDAILVAAMQASGAGWLDRQVVWLAVRAFGQKPWNAAASRKTHMRAAYELAGRKP